MYKLHPDRPIENEQAFRSHCDMLGIAPEDDPAYNLVNNLFTDIHADDDIRGRSINISGAHGIGKTTFANILHNKLAAKGHLVVNARAMFYGRHNFADYVESVLGDFYKQFYGRFGIKLKELADLTKNISVSVEAGISLLGVASVKVNSSHKINLKKSVSSDELLAGQSSVNQKLSTIFPQRVIIIIDDLDRLDADELKSALRLIEALRHLNNIFVVGVGDIRLMGAILGAGNTPNAQEYARKVFDHRVHLTRNLRDYERIVQIMVEDILNNGQSSKQRLSEQQKSVVIEAFHFLILRQIIQNIRDIVKQKYDPEPDQNRIDLWNVLHQAGHIKLGPIYQDLRGFFDTRAKNGNGHKIWTVDINGDQIVPDDNTRDGMSILTLSPNIAFMPWELDKIFRAICPASYWAQLIIPSPDDDSKVEKYQFNEGAKNVGEMFARLDQGERLATEMLGGQEPESRWSIAKRFMADPNRDDVERDRSLTQFNDMRLLRKFAIALTESLPTLLTLGGDNNEEKRLEFFVKCVDSFESQIRIERGEL